MWPAIAEAVGLQRARAVGARPTPLGWVVSLRLLPPLTTAHVESTLPVLAAYLGIARARLELNPSRADLCQIYLDIEPAMRPAYLPTDNRPVWTPYNPGDPVLLGRYETGEPFMVDLLGSGMLIGGNPGSGKSTAIRVALAGLAEQRCTALYGVDPKYVELSPWADRFTQLIRGSETDEVIAMLTGLVLEVHNRAQVLAQNGQVTFTPDFDMPQIVLVVDEWAELAAHGTKPERQQVADLLRRYVSLGRAVGCSAILATQRPTAETIDVTTRSLLMHRLAFQTGDKWGSESILGINHHEAAQISHQPGRGFYVAGGGVARPVQIYQLPVEQIGEHLCPALRL